MGVLRSFGAPLSVLALSVVAACAAPGGARAAVPVNCASPQAPRMPLAVQPLSADALAAAPGHTLPAGAAIPDQLIVRFDPAASAARQAGALSVVDPDVVSRRPHLAERIVEYAAGDTPAQAAAAVAHRAGVAFAEPDYAVRSTVVPNDPDVHRLWPFITDSTPDAPRRPGDLRAEDAWALANGAGVRVAVVDTGVDPGSKDIDGGVLRNPDDPQNGVDDDHNGLIDDTRGWDFVSDQQDVKDDGGHGTHVAGIIGARSDNGVTVTGLASHVGVVAVRALGAESGSTSDVAAGFTYAIEEYGARVVNLSLSGSSWSQLMTEGFCKYPNVLFVAAAGNDSVNVDTKPAYPCAYDLPNVICVGATDKKDKLAYFSNFGPATVEIGAPGVDIISTGFGTKTQTYSGTSQATPMVVGAAALVLQRAPALTAAELKDVILRSADPIPGLTKYFEQGRRLNAGRAVAMVSSPVVRDARVVSRDGVPTVRGTLVTEGPTDMWVQYGPKGALTKRTAVKHTTDALSFSIAVKDAPENARFQLVADNPRGHYQSEEMSPGSKPTVSIKVAKKNGLTITGVVKGLARAHIHEVELLVGKGNKAQKVSTASITIKQRGSKPEAELSARIQPSKNTSYTISWRVTAANGATVKATAPRVHT